MPREVEKIVSRCNLSVCVAGTDMTTRNSARKISIENSDNENPLLCLKRTERQDRHEADWRHDSALVETSCIILGDCSRSEHLRTPRNYLCLEINLLINVINSQCDLILPMNDIQKSET